MIGRPKNPFAQWFISAGDLLRGSQEHRIVMNRQLQIALIVERHRRQLTERILAVEHPAVGARQQCVRDVADALLDCGARFGAGTGTLNPLALQIARNRRAGKCAVTRLLHRDRGARNGRRRIEEAQALPVPRARVSARNPRGHHRLAIAVKRRQRIERAEDLWREHIRVLRFETGTDFDPTRGNSRHGP